MKILKLLVPILLLAITSSSQVTSYDFSSSVNSYSSIIGGVAIDSIEADDKLSEPIPIGFDFYFDGNSYSKLLVNSNGWVSFDTLITPTALEQKTNNLSGNISARPLLAPLWDDLDGTNGSASYKVSGVFPNRILSIEWKNWKWNSSAPSPVISFQVKLFETTNDIEFVYNPEAGSVVNGSASVGITDSVSSPSGSGNFISLSGLDNMAFISRSVETSNISLKPVAGQTFNFLKCTASMQPLGHLCDNSAAILLSTLGTGIPSGGTNSYFINGIAGTTYNPTNTIKGISSIVHVYSINGCTDTNRMIIKVDTTAKINFSFPTQVCSNQDTMKLKAFPVGGKFSGQGVDTNSNVFDPKSFLTPGSKLVSYVFTNLLNCSDTVTNFYQFDTISFSTVSVSNLVCENTLAFPLNGGVPKGGSYFGNNVTNSHYIPDTSFIDTVYYVHQVSSGCSDTSLTVLTIDTIPNVQLGLIGRYCSNSEPVILNTGIPAGGLYSGKMVNDSTYFPSSPGVDTVIYTVTLLNGCSDSAKQTVIVDSVTLSSVTSMGPFCDNTPLLNLDVGLPVGGSYSGNGVSGTNYAPSQAGAGFDTLNYSFTNSFNCKDSSFVIVTVHSSPMVTYSSDLDFCEGDLEKSLIGAVPLNGIYSGNGVDSSTSKFFPIIAGVGSHTVTYVYSNGDNCTDSASIIAKVIANPIFSLGANIEICGKETKELDPGLDSAIYLWNTGEVTRKITVQESKVFSVTVTDTITGCKSSDEIRVEYDAICVSVDENLKNSATIVYYPNPTMGIIHLKINGLAPQQVLLKVFDLSGAELTTSNFTIENLNSEIQLDLSDFDSGQYLISVHSNLGALVYRITKY